MYLPDLNPGNATPDFNASFNLFQGVGSDNPSHGVTFYYGAHDDTVNLGDNAAVNGLKVRFKVEVAATRSSSSTTKSSWSIPFSTS